ncbi:MAG: hypothetical protein QOE68_4065, partial [Thermoanaerobaculia bacterium]|nr:hypothetical protein [Thermoanaerobaculia bacterium]
KATVSGGLADVEPLEPLSGFEPLTC